MRIWIISSMPPISWVACGWVVAGFTFMSAISFLHSAIINIVAFVLKVTANRIKNDHRTRVSDMDEIVHSRAAYIHLYLSRL